jgi:hypothetical protein
MRIRSTRQTFLIAAMLATAVPPTSTAQWSIGAPEKREPPPGKHRYAMLVFASPIPGREAEFNEWYTNTHMGTWCSYLAGSAHNASGSSPM